MIGQMPGAGEAFVQYGGEMGALTRAANWSASPLGPLDTWPQSLRTSVSTMLRSPYPIILFWGPHRIMLYNDPFRPILGSKHPRVLGAPGRDALAEEWQLLGPLMERVDATGEPLYIENGNVNFARRPGGLREESYFTWSYNPTIGEAGEIAGLFAIASETTGQVVGDRRLGLVRELSIRMAQDRTVEAIFRSLEETAAQATHDLPFVLLYMLKGHEAQLVSCANLPCGAPAAPRVVGRAAPGPWPLFEVAAAGEEALADVGARWGVLPGGPWPEAATRALVLPVPMGADGEASAVLVAGLGPLRPLDEAYQNFLQLLARQLAASISSTRAYAQERQRVAALVELDASKTAFFSNMSHEFRTPLTLILGPIEDAMSTPLRALRGKELDVVRRNALRLHKMVNTLLDFSRMEAGRTQALFVATDLAELTRHLASTFDSAVAKAGLNFHVHCPPLPEAIYVDAEMWENIVFNLLSNALKYTHEGEIVVSLRCDATQALLSVRDTGVGIPADALPHVFERFYRARSAEGRSFEGTGIGLAMVQELAKQHGGSVAVESQLGVGTTLTVHIPRGAAHLPAERLRNSSAERQLLAAAEPYLEEADGWTPHGAAKTPPRDAAVGPTLAPARILLVDDNADLRGYVATLLRDHFSQVETATRGDEALAKARATLPDLILSDVMMPGLDGFGLVRELRNDAQTRGIPIILLSARAGDEATVEGLRSGADDYVLKPFSARELIARVRTQLDMAQVRRSLARLAYAEELQRDALAARDAWLTVVGHELRTPLSGLTISLRALARKVGGKAEINLDPVQRNLQRLTRHVEQLIDVAGLISGHLALTPKAADLADLVSQTVDLHRGRAAAARCEISLITSPVAGHYDSARVQQLVESLLDNAVKFGAGKPITVEVGANSGFAMLRVADHGCGVDPQDQQRIFSRFERAASTRHFGGFGLGLWLARHIAEGHGGSIEFVPTSGGGATFVVSLPATVDSPPPAGIARLRQPQKDAPHGGE